MPFMIGGGGGTIQIDKSTAALTMTAGILDLGSVGLTKSGPGTLVVGTLHLMP